IIMNTMTTFLNMELTRQSAVSGLEKIMNVINRESTTPDVAENKKRDVSVEKEATLRKNGPCIEFENVDFSYEEGSYLYKNLSCQINYKESIGLVGSSGSGKSTFTKLVMRLYDVQNGTIKVHGRNIKDFKSHDLRMTFGVVPQNPFIFHGTIMDNIRIARPDCENIDIIRAMEIAHVHEFVNDLPKGWHTVIGDGGMHLSGGQKQRIAIARAVLGNPDILIFDEATSALDNVSERHIQEAMETLMKTHTVLIVAHRLTTIKNVDRIMVFDKGEIVEEGSYDELAQKEGGIFYDLLNN
ncbi:MAG: ATP-binding cassette domain-containing protein, partial [Clostridia bacterium]|nr:ATP-binding cassette domain-containing protein [Clostridia bacterium]